MTYNLRQWSAVRARRRKQKTEGLKFAGGIGKGRYARGSRGRRQIEVGTTSTFVLREETSSPYASRLQVYSKIQDCMNVFAKYARIFRIQMSFNFSYNRTVFSVRPLVGTKNTVLEVGIIYFRIVYHSGPERRSHSGE